MFRLRSTFFPLLSIALCISIFTSLNGAHALAGAKSYVGSKTPRGPLVSFDKIDHSAWNALLKKYVDQDGLVNYQTWHASTEDRRKLASYLASLSQASPKLNAKREAKLAFWINAYNAVTISGILKEYPTSSIRNHTAKLFGYNIWHDYQLYVGGTPYSLDTMEHKILRKLSEPRIHFAIVCASIGCPKLLNEAYVPKRLEGQLELNAKDFFSRPQNFKYDESGGRFELSAILDWFEEDFGENRAAVLRRIAAWLPTAKTQAAARQGSDAVSYLSYDWELNDQKSKD